MIYLAPLQGFTDFVYRNAYARVFSGIDAFFIPYITTKGSQILNKYTKEILPENNRFATAIPQILVKDEDEIFVMCSLLRNYGYGEINLNLGCPYPMVTNRGKGSKLLSEPGQLDRLLAFFFEHFNLELSVKMRAGFESVNDLERIIPVLNRFPLKRVILHPRVARQLYKGEIHTAVFQYALGHLEQIPVYNGDIDSVSGFQQRAKLFPGISDWMLGRGVLKNTFLPEEIKGVLFSEAEKRNKLQEFHNLIFEKYLEIADNPGNALNKLQQFWIYFSHHFSDQPNVLKLVRKSKNVQILKIETEKLFRSKELTKTNQ